MFLRRFVVGFRCEGGRHSFNVGMFLFFIFSAGLLFGCCRCFSLCVCVCVGRGCVSRSGSVFHFLVVDELFR